uniref:CUB domain-containing protein n=1 Tax=Meloidogyne hapla TaxID=6305 RepID=A0A1I8BL85_MELHA
TPYKVVFHCGNIVLRFGKECDNKQGYSLRFTLA